MKSRAALARAEQLFPPLVTQQLQDIEKDLGGREAVVGMLALAPLTKDLRYVLGMLGDPRNNGQSLAEICALGNILPGALLKHLADAAMLRGKVKAAQKVGDGIAAVAEDVMRRAAPYEDTCNGGCAGIGTITPEPTKDEPNPSPEPCETCQGTGRLLYRPDLERQKLAIEMAQLLPKSGGINVAVQQNNHPGGGGVGATGFGLLERLQEVTDRILYGPTHPSEHSADATDAEIVEKPAESPDA